MTTPTNRIGAALHWRMRWVAERCRPFTDAVHLLGRRILLALSGVVPGLRKRIWQQHQQSRELEFHATIGGTYRMSEEYERKNADLFTSLGFHADEYAGKCILDLGAGSRIRTVWFRGARVYAIEPLADQFRPLGQCNFDQAAEVFSIPAEQFVDKLAGQVDFLVCLNVLDHVFEPRVVLEHCRNYLRPGGRFLLQTDCHTGLADLQHPAEFSQDWLLQQLQVLGFTIEKKLEDRLVTGRDDSVTLILRRT